MRQFYAGTTVQTTCKRKGGRIRPDGPIPGSLSAVRPATLAGTRGRTVSAAALTVFDVLEQGADSLLSNPLGLIRGGGLRGGYFFETRNAIDLRKVVYVPGVVVSGSVTDGGSAQVVISGAKATHGRLRFRHGRVSGVLGGRRVSGRIRSLAKPARAALAAHVAQRSPRAR